MTLVAEIAGVIAWVSLCLGLPPALWLGLLALAGWPPGRKPDDSPSSEPAEQRRIAIVVPAHDEALLIAETVRGLRAQDYPADRFEVVVVADNCRDQTAAIARTAGARVLERGDRPGKGQALDHAFKLLLAEDWQAVLVVDADSRLHPRALARLNRALAEGALALQLRYGVENPAASWRTAAMELALASFNALRPLGRTRLGGSAGLFGNGFCLTREALERVPYGAGSVVEDLEYHTMLLRQGIHVGFLAETWVVAQMPTDAAASRSQRVRWERGRASLARQLLPRLFERGWRRGRLETAIDVCMPPVSLVGMALLPPLALPGLPRTAAALGLAALALHFAVATLRFGHPLRALQVAVHLPWYVAWKIWILLASFLRQRNLPWVRTQRHEREK